MNVAITTLSLGENYTRDYTLRLIDDVLNKTQHSVYITTDCKSTITNKYGDNERIVIKEISRDNLTIRLNTDGGFGTATDFNFNMRYMCLDLVKNLEDTIVVFTDCDNSLDWWDETTIQEWASNMKERGFDFFAPRNDYKLSQYLEMYNKVKAENPKEGIFWHKLYNFDLIDNPKPEWDNASLPAEYLLVFFNDGKKLEAYYNEWKKLHDHLVNQGWTYGTWAEGFEIGVSALMSGYNAYDLSWHHPVWGRVFTPNGYKVGHATES